VVEKYKDQVFSNFISKLPLPESDLRNLTERDVYIGKDLNEKLNDIQICVDNLTQERFLFIEGFSFPPQSFEGTTEICRI